MSAASEARPAASQGTSCVVPQTLWDRLLRRQRYSHIWRTDRREPLGSYMDCSPYPETVYRIAVHQTCVRCDEKRVFESKDCLPPYDPST